MWFRVGWTPWFSQVLQLYCVALIGVLFSPLLRSPVPFIGKPSSTTKNFDTTCSSYESNGGSAILLFVLVPLESIVDTVQLLTQNKWRSFFVTFNFSKWPTWRIILLFYNTFITVLYMFRATPCSSSGGQIVLIQHLVSSLWKQVGGLKLLKCNLLHCL